MAGNPLAGWDNFYVILGSSGAALTGLQFVVVALNARRRSAKDASALEAFATPTIVHFGAVLLVAALITMPRHTFASLQACLLLAGLGGLVYASYVLLQTRRQQSYDPVLSDWIWHIGLPFVAYAAILVAAIVLSRRPEPALYAVAGSALLLLFIGIHNAWDAAVWMTTQMPEREP